MSKTSKGFMECTKCNVWGDIPVEFKETKHFGKCPKCNGPMYLMRGFDPKDAALDTRNKVTCGVMLHGVKI